MTDEQRIELQQIILSKMESTKNKILSFEEMSGPVSPENAIGRVSRMDAINNKSIVESALREAKNKLARLEEVTEFIRRPEFGRCKRCSNEIPFERIKLMPESVFCVRCA